MAQPASASTGRHGPLLSSALYNLGARTMPPARLLLLVPLLFVTACRSEPRTRTEDVVVWRTLGSWSGRGDEQTESFTSDTGGFRVHWETTHEAPEGAGRLRVVFRSGDSGREIIEAIDARGAGSGTEEVAAERPRWYYLTIESANVDWTVTVDERVEGRRIDAGRSSARRRSAPSTATTPVLSALHASTDLRRVRMKNER